MRTLICSLLLLAVGRCAAQDLNHALQVPDDIRALHRNVVSHRGSGSCVQASGGMCGVKQNIEVVKLLLWDTPDYGPAVRGGSDPQRVAQYCRERGIRIYNITGKGSIEWMKYASRNGLWCAIGAGANHFQTLCYHDPTTNEWHVCNNNEPRVIRKYDDASFRRLHYASGPWVVIFDYPPDPPNPFYRS